MKIFYNPLAVLGNSIGLYGAIVIVAALIIAAYTGGIHLDGALDMHIIDFPRSVIPAEIIISWLCLALVLFVTSKVTRGNGGIIAHLAATGLARFPYLIAVIIAAQPFFKGAIEKALTVTDGKVVLAPQGLMDASFIIALFAIIALMIWGIIMLYYGYKQAARVAGNRVGISFVIGLIIAEAISKILLLRIYRI